MTLDEYIDLVESAGTTLETKLKEVLEPVNCEVLTHYVQSGMQSEDSWLASLRKDNSESIRMAVLLTSELSSSELSRTAGAKNFKPQYSMNFEIIHSLSPTNSKTSYRDFIKDCVRAQWVMETNRRLGENNNIIIERYSIRPGIRPSDVQVLHYARGEVTLNFGEIRY